MDDSFPRIWFTKKFEVDPFIDRASRLDLASVGLKFIIQEDPGGMGHRLLTIQDKTTPEGSPRIAIYKSSDEKIVVVGYYSNVRTYEDYVSGARSFLDPFIAEYERVYKTKLRYKIKSKKELMFVFPPKSGQAFKAFIAGANTSSLHPFDWRRLYILAYVCHATRVDPPEMDFIRLLMQNGFKEDYAEEVASVFMHCLGMAKLRKFNSIG